MEQSRIRVRRLAPEGISRRGALLLCAALLSSAAVLIVVNKRDVIEIDVVMRKVLGWAGLALAVSGGLYLMHIWWVDRFQITIGRLMLAVAVIAFLLAYVLSMLPSK